MIAKTTDGGLSWERHDTGTGRFVWDVEFVSEIEGWAVGSFGMVIYSDDGGVSWAPLQGPVSSAIRGRAHGLGLYPPRELHAGDKGRGRDLVPRVSQ